jgi:hypothetical protein
MDELTQARVNTIVDISDALIEQTVNLIEIHGKNDPHNFHILASAYTMTINRIDKISPGFKQFMHQMLKDRD